MQKKPKVVFTLVEAGMGHIIPMRGASDAFKKKYGDKCEVVDSYIFSDSESESVRAMGKELCDHTVRASVNYLYNKFEAMSYALSSKLTLKFLDAHFKSQRPFFYKDLEKLQPDLLVSSYYLPSHLAKQANQKGFTDTLIATYSPDPYIYPAWDRDCDLFFVNNDKAYEMAVNGGFIKDKVKRVPCVFRKEILNAKQTKSEARLNLGLKEKFTILYTGGAFGTRGTEKLVKEILTRNLHVNFIVVCGKNEKMQDNMRSFCNLKGDNTDYDVLGFTEKLPEYILASDIVIGKAGSNTLMETAHLERPFAVYRESSRLEEKTAEYFVKKGCAKRIRNPKKLADYIELTIENPDELNRFNENFKEFKDASGAEQVADALFSLLKTKYPDL